MYRLRRPGWMTALVLLTALSFVAAACSGGDDTAEELAAVDVSASLAGIEPEMAEAAGSGDDGLDRQDAAPVMNTFVLGRDIIYTADLTVAVSDVDDGEDTAKAIVTALGGFLFGQQSTGSPERQSLLIFKVPPERFEAALAQLSELGSVRSQNVSADDVTERVVDLDSRIRSAEASVERLNAFLAAATDIKAIAELESQLLERETALESLRGQLRTLRDRVEFASISLSLTEALSRPDLAVSVTAYPGGDGSGAACPGATDLSVVQGEAATVCFEISNTGDTPLRGFQISDPVLDVTTADLIVVFGDLNATMEPGESVFLATELIVERDLRTQTTVTATPIDEEGNPVEARPVATTATISVGADDPGGLPGFRDGLEAGAEVIGVIGGAIVLGAGLVLPLLPIILMGGAFVLWRRRRNETAGDVAA